MQLHQCPVRQRLCLTKVDCGDEYSLRLCELGLRPGVEVTVTQKASFGGLVLNVSGSRLAVDHRSARRIEAEVIA